MQITEQSNRAKPEDNSATTTARVPLPQPIKVEKVSNVVATSEQKMQAKGLGVKLAEVIACYLLRVLISPQAAEVRTAEVHTGVAELS